MTPDLIAAFGQFGPFGLLLMFMIWEKSKSAQTQKERTESDKMLASALTALTVTIQHLEQRSKP